MSATAKRLAWQAGALTAAIAALQIFLSCEDSRWPVAAIMLSYSTWILLRIGPLTRDKRVSFEEKRFAEFLGAIVFITGGAVLVTPMC